MINSCHAFFVLLSKPTLICSFRTSSTRCSRRSPSRRGVLWHSEQLGRIYLQFICLLYNICIAVFISISLFHSDHVKNRSHRRHLRLENIMAISSRERKEKHIVDDSEKRPSAGHADTFASHSQYKVSQSHHSQEKL